MKRLDFASVIAVLRRNISDERYSSQPEFLSFLFKVVIDDPQYEMEIDESQACRWINGLERASPKIIRFCEDKCNQKKLAAYIQEEFLRIMPDSAMAIQELYDLVLQATNVSIQKKMEMTDGYTIENDKDKAVFITEVLCLAMQLPFRKRDIREKQISSPGNLSPSVENYIFDADIPRPCKCFLGRKRELEHLHALLLDHSKVFLHGIPGIGKSELAKAYAKRHRKEYTNIIYVNYPGDLKRTVIDMDFADNLTNEGDDARFKRHNRFLRSLREDTLLIVDNFNVSASQDQLLDVVLKYRCRILFTTRCRYENHVSMELGELSWDTLSELMGFFSRKRRKIKTRSVVSSNCFMAILSL